MPRSKTGSVTLAGSLADGTPWSAAGEMRSDYTAALFTPLYRRRGFLAGEFAFAFIDPAFTAISSPGFTWLRPAGVSADYYPAGWPAGLRLGMIGGRYSAAGSLNFGQGAADRINGNARLVFAGSGLNATTPVSVNPETGVADVITSLRKSCRMDLAAKTGIITGSFRGEDGEMNHFRGVLVNDGTDEGGFGYFLHPPAGGAPGSGASGSMQLQSGP
jgi:hypothetical protein